MVSSRRRATPWLMDLDQIAAQMKGRGQLLEVLHLSRSNNGKHANELFGFQPDGVAQQLFVGRIFDHLMIPVGGAQLLQPKSGQLGHNATGMGTVGGLFESRQVFPDWSWRLHRLATVILGSF